MGNYTYYSKDELSGFNQKAVQGVKMPFELLPGPDRVHAGLKDEHGNQFLGYKVAGANPLYVTTIVRPDGTIQTLSSPLKIRLNESRDASGKTYIPNSKDAELLTSLTRDGNVTQNGLFSNTEYTLTPPGGKAELEKQAAAAAAAKAAQEAERQRIIDAAQQASEQSQKSGGPPVIPVLPAGDLGSTRVAPTGENAGLPNQSSSEIRFTTSR